MTEEEKRLKKNERQREYARRTGYTSNAKYNKNQTKAYTIRIMKNSEADIIAWLDSQENKAGYIKDLIREDMKKKQN